MTTRPTFQFNGETYELFDNPHNATITNERAVELALAFSFVDECDGGDGLEVGNVLSHYDYVAPMGREHHVGSVPARRIVDRYEASTRVKVERLDVFAIEGAYDWIVSISTLEHVRDGVTDGTVANEQAPAAALTYLRGLLKPGGRMFITIGLGQRAAFDEFLLAPDVVAAFRARTLVRSQQVFPDAEPVVRWIETETPEKRTYGPENGARSVWVAWIAPEPYIDDELDQ